MKTDRILNLVFGVVVIGLVILLFQNGCERKKIDFPQQIFDLKEQNIKLNDIILQKDNEISRLRYFADSLKAFKTKEVVRTVYKNKSPQIVIKRDTVVEDSIVYVNNEITSNIFQEITYFQDSTYELISNIFYTGDIEKIEYGFSVKKYPVNFIPTTNYAIREITIKEKIRSKNPRVYVLGGINSSNFVENINIDLGLSVRTNKDRIYSVSTNPFSYKDIRLQVQQPLLYSKK
jgi:hypothetical protein